MDAAEDNGVASAALPTQIPSSVIAKGAVAGVLPQSEAFAVNYPGYPSSTSRAVDTLGGLDEIAKVRSSGSNQLELRFRPEDPYSHPAFGERHAFAGLLLKISKTPPESSNDDKEQLSADVVARISEAYDFEGMVDYQHVLPVHAAEARRKRQRCVFDEETNLEEEGDVMMLVPPLFSLKNTPEETVLNPPPNLFSKNLQKSVVEHRWEMDIEPCLALAFNIKRVPEKVNWEDNIPKDTAEWQSQLAVSKLFEARPIWPRRSIHEQLLEDGLQVSDYMLRRLLFRAGYYFSTGPFGRFWIRKGYDPRKDPDSKKFQKVDFRVPSQLRNVIDANGGAGLKQTRKNICRFQVFPRKIFTSLQLFELDDDYIRDEIQKITDQAVCMHTRGWFSESILRALRLRVSFRFLSVFPKEGAETLLRFNIEEFERCKKREVLSKINAMKTQNINQDSAMPSILAITGSNDTEHPPLGQDGPNYEIGNDEEEEEEENVDAYDSSAVAFEDGCFSAETSFYQVRDSITNDYLHDLLHEFPFYKDGKDSSPNKDVQGGGSSDGEYEIYEQDDSDDEDDFT